MWLNLSTIVLLPVLITQGMIVRKRTPLLPEPQGDRDGLVGEGKPLSLLILGDSAAAGVGVERQEEALSGAIISELKNDYTLKWRLHARTGLTTQQVCEAIVEIDERDYDVIVTSIVLMISLN